VRRRSAVLVIAICLDLAFGELPNRCHPVAWLGRGIGAGERGMRSLPAPATGVLLATVFPLGAALVGRRAVLAMRGAPKWTRLVGEALLLKQTFAARALFEHARAVRERLEAEDLEGARSAAAMMVSRDTATLSERALASAAIESLSENTSDSVIAPLTWYLVGGLPAAAAYRAINTLDAMVGYRSRGWVGTPSARLDDAASYIPARLMAGLYALAGGGWPTFTGARAAHRATPSPNSGWPMAAAAHALGVRLEKAGHHVLNESGRHPLPGDIAAAERLTWKALGTGAAAAGVAALIVPDGCSS
jgi:adenosylcobinamide-phosphate synthase